MKTIDKRSKAVSGMKNSKAVRLARRLPGLILSRFATTRGSGSSGVSCAQQ